jgi:hypothetical protein
VTPFPAILYLFLLTSAFAFQKDFVFEENHGQARPGVAFLGRAGGPPVEFRGSEIVFPGDSEDRLTLRFPGQSANSRWEPLDKLASTSSYFIGRNPEAWIRAVPHHARLIRRGIFPGIDLIFYPSADQSRLEFDFVLAPGADSRLIRLAWGNAGRVSFLPDGSIDIHNANRVLRVGRPSFYQNRDGARHPVDGRFVAEGNEIRFEVGPHDPELPLTIDPTIDLVSFVSGSGTDRITATLGRYVAGVTDSSNLSGFGRSSGKDIFIWDGSFYTLYGGSGDEEPTSIAIAGNSIVVAGWTNSRDFPLTGSRSFQRSYGGGASDGFVLVNPGPGSGFSSYLGGSGDDRILAVCAVGDAGDYVLAGETTSTDFPVLLAVQPASGGGRDGFLTRIGSTGLISESTYWGGSGDDSVLAIDSSPSALWFAGRTNSPDLRLVSPLQSQPAGGSDAFLSRLNLSGAQSVIGFSTYFGGSGDDEIRALRIGPDQAVWTGGNTTSADLPLTSPSQSSLGGDADAWLARFDPVQFLPSFVTYFGGSGRDELTAIVHDGNGDVYAAGFTNSADLPVRNATQFQPGGADDGFIARFDAAGQPRMATYAGGSGNDRLRALWLDSTSQTLTAGGETDSADFPGKDSAARLSGPVDGLLIRLHEDAIYVTGLTLGKDLTTGLNVSVTGPESAGLPVTVRSSDPSLVLVNGGSFSTATAFQLSALASEGTVDIIVSAPGYTPRHVPVTLRPSFLVNAHGVGVDLPLNTSLSLAFRFATTDPVTGNLIFQKLRSGIDPAVGMYPAATGLLQVSASYNGYSQDLSASLRGVAAGSTVVSIVSPLFAIRGPGQFTVRVGATRGPSLQPPAVAVGKGLQTALSLPLAPNSPQAGGAVIRLTSEDPSRLLLAATATSPGVATLSLAYFPGNGVPPGVWVQGAASSGTARIRIETDNADPVFATVAFAPSVIAIMPPAESSAGFHNPDLTSTALDIWSTNNIFTVLVQLDGPPPAGFAVGPQAPASSAAARFTVASSDNSVVDASFTYDFDLSRSSLSQGVAYVRFRAGLLKSGVSTLSVSSDSFRAITPLAVTVRPNDLPFANRSISLGKGIMTDIYFDNAFDFPANVTATITSSDPGRLLVASASQFDEGPKVTTVLSSPKWFYVSALADSGDASVTISAPGYGSRTLLVHMVPVTFRLVPSTLTATLGDYARLNVVWSYAGQPPNSYTSLLRPGTTRTFALDVADPSILRNDSQVVTVSGYRDNTTLVTVKPGTTRVSLRSTSEAVIDPVFAESTVTVISGKLSFSPPVLPLGKDLQAPLPGLPGFSAQTKTTLRSLDPSKVLLSVNPALPGQASLEWTGQKVYVQALSDSGDAIVTASTAGSSDAQLKVRLNPTALGLYELYSSPPVLTTSVGSTLTLRVAPVPVDAASGNPITAQEYSFRPGIDPFEVRLVSGNPSLGRLFSPVAFLGGFSQNTTQFRAEALGSTEISVVPPDGFIDGGPVLRRTIQVTQPRLVLGDVTLGKDMQYYHPVSVSGASASSGPSVITITSSDPSKLLLSDSPVSVGKMSVTIPSGNGSSYWLFYSQALASSGEVTLKATAPGFDPATATVRLEPSFFAFTRDPYFRNTATTEVNSTLRASVYLTHLSNSAINQFLRPGIGPFTIPVTSSDIAVLAPPALVFPVGYDQISPGFFASATGDATLQLGAPEGFSLAPDGWRTLTASVVPRRFYVSTVSLGKDRATPLYPGIFTAIERPTPIRFISGNPSLVTVSTDPKSAGGAELTIDTLPSSNRPTVWLHGLASAGTATVTVTAPGFTPATANVTLSTSGFAFGYPPSISAVAGRTFNVVVTAGQPLRGGSQPVTLVIDSSNAAVLPAPASVMFQPGESSQTVSLTGKAPGTAILTISNTDGGSAASVLVVTVTAP